jgi:hypothetical protein
MHHVRLEMNDLTLTTIIHMRRDLWISWIVELGAQLAGPGPILQYHRDEEQCNKLTIRRWISSSLRYAHPVRRGVVRAVGHCRVAIWRLVGGKGGFQPTGKERASGRGVAQPVQEDGGWQTWT